METSEQTRPFEIVMTVPREDSGQPFVSRPLPPGVSGAWSAKSVTISATLTAASASLAVAAIEALVPDLARAEGVRWSVHSPSQAEQADSERALRHFTEVAGRATPEQRARAERAVARITRQSAGQGRLL